MAFSIPFVFIISFTKKPVNKTVKDSHNKMISHQDIKLEDTKRCFYSILHKKTDLKSARQDLQGKGIFMLFLGTSTSLKQASEWNSSSFFMIPVLKSLSKNNNKKKFKKLNLSNVKQGISCPTNSLQLCLVLPFFILAGFGLGIYWLFAWYSSSLRK